MKEITNQSFEGERSLFRSENLRITKCHFHDGESPLKESRDLEVLESVFSYKYPLWYGKGIKAINNLYEVNARAGIWYTKDALFKDSKFLSPKCFRKCSDLTLENIEFLDAEETFWWNKDSKLINIKAVNADYFGMGSKNIEADNLDIVGNYLFDGAKDVVIKNSRLECKDAFWNSKNIRIENCLIEGEYFGWNSENITIINSVIKSHQGFCYMKNLYIRNTKIDGSDLTFEYCEDIDAEIVGSCLSIKNPISGKISIDNVDEIILDEARIDKGMAIVVGGKKI